jgi:hypothetical protein
MARTGGSTCTISPDPHHPPDGSFRPNPRCGFGYSRQTARPGTMCDVGRLRPDREDCDLRNTGRLLPLWAQIPRAAAALINPKKSHSRLEDLIRPSNGFDSRHLHRPLNSGQVLDRRAHTNCFAFGLLNRLCCRRHSRLQVDGTQIDAPRSLQELAAGRLDIALSV